MGKRTAKGKQDWASMDTRVRARKTTWSLTERKQLETALANLPDRAESIEVTAIKQPGIGPPEVERQAGVDGPEGEEDAEPSTTVDDAAAPAATSASRARNPRGVGGESR